MDKYHVYHISSLQVINNCVCLLVILICTFVHAIQSSVYAFGCTSFVLVFINMHVRHTYLEIIGGMCIFFVFETLHYLNSFSAIFTLVV